MKAALLQTCIDHLHLQCGVCPHACILRKNQRGKCGVRENQDGIIVALNDGLAVAKAVDPIEKKPLKRFMPGTMIYSTAAAGCNLSCPWCQNHAIANVSPSTYYFGHPMHPEEHIDTAKKAHAKSIAMTYSEPTVALEYTQAIFKHAKQAGLKTVFVSNGYITLEALSLLMPWMDAANIDFKTDDDAVMKQFGGFDSGAVLKTMQAIKEAGIHLEVTTLIVPGINDSHAAMNSMAKTFVKTVGKAVPWHLSRFFPAFKMQHCAPTSMDTLKQAKTIALAHGIQDVVLGNV